MEFGERRIDCLMHFLLAAVELCTLVENIRPRHEMFWKNWRHSALARLEHPRHHDQMSVSTFVSFLPSGDGSVVLPFRKPPFLLIRSPKVVFQAADNKRFEWSGVLRCGHCRRRHLGVAMFCIRLALVKALLVFAAFYLRGAPLTPLSRIISPLSPRHGQQMNETWRITWLNDLLGYNCGQHWFLPARCG